MKKRCAFDTLGVWKLPFLKGKAASCRIVPLHSAFLFIVLKGLQSMRPLVFYMSEIQPVISFIISRIEGIALVWRLFPIASI